MPKLMERTPVLPPACSVVSPSAGSKGPCFGRVPPCLRRRSKTQVPGPVAATRCRTAAVRVLRCGRKPRCTMRRSRRPICAVQGDVLESVHPTPLRVVLGWSQPIISRAHRVLRSVLNLWSLYILEASRSIIGVPSKTQASGTRLGGTSLPRGWSCIPYLALLCQKSVTVSAGPRGLAIACEASVHGPRGPVRCPLQLHGPSAGMSKVGPNPRRHPPRSLDAMTARR